MKIHFSAAYATSFSIDAVATVDVASAPVAWDTPGVIFLKLLAIASLVALNGFFVASEFALVKVRTSQLDTLIAQGNQHARHARQVAAHLDAYLSATQLGITLASLGLGWLGEPFLAEMIDPFFGLVNITSPALIEAVSFTLAFTSITVLHIVVVNWRRSPLPSVKRCRQPCGSAGRWRCSTSCLSQPSRCLTG